MFTNNGRSSTVVSEEATASEDMAGQAIRSLSTTQIEKVQMYDSQEDALNAIVDAGLTKSNNIENVEQLMEEYSGINPGKIYFECDSTGCSITIPGVGGWAWGW
jgi:hypothetical protein